MRRTVELGFLLALALILSYVESLIPFSFGIPGIKLGLPNLVVLLLLYDKIESVDQETVTVIAGKSFFPKNVREALMVNVLRIILSGFLFSNLYAILYALSGAAFSFAAMLIGKKWGRLSMIGVSVLGGVFHNMGQLVTAAFVVETFGVFYYLPFLLAAGTATGALLGFVGMELIPYLRRM